MTNAEKINRLLVECVEQSDAFFLNTVEEGKPKSRPISFHMLVDDTNYFGVGAMKEVYKQMRDNPWVEICGLLGHGKQFFRYYGRAVFEEQVRRKWPALSCFAKKLSIMEKIYAFKCCGLLHHLFAFADGLRKFVKRLKLSALGELAENASGLS